MKLGAHGRGKKRSKSAKLDPAAHFVIDGEAGDGTWRCQRCSPAEASQAGVCVLEATPLGGAQQVGKSCILLRIKHRLIMLDCGMHLGFTDSRRNPDFSQIGDLSQLCCVVVTHFHLDHCAALPVLTEQLGYHGPIFMTTPTKAMCGIMLEDYRRIMVERYGTEQMFSAEMIQSCLSRVTCVNFGQVFHPPDDPDIMLTAYHAGHVLGAAMISVAAVVGGREVTALYTGDYNMTADRYLAAAKIPKRLGGASALSPDLLITESTYATSIRDSRLLGESEMLQAIDNCVRAGGNALIPVFALGRVQELCMLLEKYWSRCSLGHVPIYFASSLAEQATRYYHIYSRWSGTGGGDGGTFSLRYVQPWSSKFTKQQTTAALKSGPMVLFATSAMLEGGLALEAFKVWASDEKNLIVMPGHCVARTIGGKLQAGARAIPCPSRSGKKEVVNVKCKVKQVVNISAHTDSKGIMDLVSKFTPKLVCLVHGELNKVSEVAYYTKRKNKFHTAQFRCRVSQRK